MTIVDCPLCCSAVALPDDAVALECPTCDVTIELAETQPRGPLPVAA